MRWESQRNQVTGTSFKDSPSLWDIDEARPESEALLYDRFSHGNSISKAVCN